MIDEVAVLREARERMLRDMTGSEFHHHLIQVAAEHAIVAMGAEYVDKAVAWDVAAGARESERHAIATWLRAQDRGWPYPRDGADFADAIERREHHPAQWDATPRRPEGAEAEGLQPGPAKQDAP